MQLKDNITITISVAALLFSFCSLIITILNFKRNGTRLKIEQLNFVPHTFLTRAIPNRLYLDQKQSTDLWRVIPILHLIIYIKIYNLSYTGITISSFIINDNFLVSKINAYTMGEELSLSFFQSNKSENRDLKEHGGAVPMSCGNLKSDDYNLISIGDRIESKASIEGIIIASGNWDLYNAINDGMNKLTIVTPDKQIDTYVQIDKTFIPDFSKIDS